MDPSHAERLQAQVDELRARLSLLEQALARSGSILPPRAAQGASGPSHPPQVATATVNVDQPLIPGPQTSAVAPPPPLPIVGETFGNARLATERMSAPGAAVVETGRAKDRSLESRIGSQWFNRIGIVALLIGVSWFLKLAFDNHWIGPLGRVVIGLVAGSGLIAWSERFRRKGYPAFSYSLKAVGSGTLYLAMWAAFSVYHLLPSSVAFVAMIAVTAFNAYMAWMQDAELLALYAIVGGLSTPLLLSTGENHEVTLLSYLFCLDVAVLVLTSLRPWSRLLFSAFAGTAMFFAGWYFSFYSNDQFARTALFVTLFFLLFALAPRLLLVPSGPGATSGWNTLAMGLMPVANAGLAFLALYDMLERRPSVWAEPWLAVVFAAFYLLLLNLPARGILRPRTELSGTLELTAAVVFLSLAIPLKTHGRWLTVGWLAEGAALLWVARRAKVKVLRGLALLCLCLGLGALVTINPPAAATPVWNQRFATYCVGIAVFVFVTWLAGQSARDEVAEDGISWSGLAATASVVVNVLILVGIGWEIHAYWWYVRWRGVFELMHDYRMYAQFTYSTFFMIFGAILLAAGFWRHSAFVRWQALILLAVSVGKVFLVDTSTLSEGYRILSFLGLGVLLLAVSFVYQRDWLHLRTPERDAA